MATPRPPLVATGQQIGVGWTPALSVVKALAALAWARRLGGKAVYWLADEDHDRQEVARSVALEGDRLRPLTFSFDAPPGTATGWLPWTPAHQRQAEAAWGPLPLPAEPTLRGHALALGEPLWRRGLESFSPTRPELRDPIQGTLEAWRAMDLEDDLIARADTLAAAEAPLPLDPRIQAAWFSLDPRTGLRRRLERGQPCPKGHWLSPGAALRPLMQSLLLPVTHVVLGPGERAYWRLAEPLWERVGLVPPVQIPRPSVFLSPRGLPLAAERLDDLRQGRWEALATPAGPWPSQAALPRPDPAWPPALQARFAQEMQRTRARLTALDRRLARSAAADALGCDPERLRQALFPLGRPQERVLPGLLWLRQEALLDLLLTRLDGPAPLHLLEQP